MIFNSSPCHSPRSLLSNKTASRDCVVNLIWYLLDNEVRRVPMRFEFMGVICKPQFCRINADVHYLATVNHEDTKQIVFN